MADLEQELLSALEAVETAQKGNCNCQEQASLSLEDPFGKSLSDPGVALDAALDALTSTTDSDAASLRSLAAQDELEFADLEQESILQLQDLLTLIEKYPGLKITFSY
jgi:hypothetical protein